VQYFGYRRVATEIGTLLSDPHLVSRGLEAER
jgi:hypothetical protein